ncbi:MAG: GGDEF domain-containing protein, partial [Myxococcales bacterium]|nr:GGDEF domain-containing protein [Myxococcales bacterium]
IAIVTDPTDLETLGGADAIGARGVRLVTEPPAAAWGDRDMFALEAAPATDAERDHLSLLSALATYVVRANAELEEARFREQELADAQQRLTEQNILLRELSVVDELTGLRNRRYFDRTMSYEMDRVRRYDRTLSLVMIDVDHFKRINDTYGHDMGDCVLKAVARLLEDSVRKSDVASRYGGEEFGLVLPETRAVGAYHVAERVRSSVEAAVIEGMRITVSVGVATASPDWTGDVMGLVRAADQALYRAKREGRNRIVVADLEGGTR